MREVELPRSKSVVAREAMIAAVRGLQMPDSGESEDGEVIIKALSCKEELVDVRSSGTAARFAIAFYGSRCGHKIIDGSEQMRKRPVGAIVEAMRSLGAKIEYLGAEGHLPVSIEDCANLGDNVEVDASESSQTISALMLIGVKNIIMKGEVVSEGYIELTRRVMRGDYCDKDWSSAVFWYGRVAVGDEDEVLLRGMKMNSGQPDENVVEVYKKLGVTSEETPEGVRIYKKGEKCEMFEMNCGGCIDMVPVLVASLCRLGVRFRISGVAGLQKKESRRGSVMAREMRKLGYLVEFDGENMRWNGEKCMIEGEADVEDDHRIAMAIIVAGGIVNDTKCIDKSYKGLVI